MPTNDLLIDTNVFIYDLDRSSQLHRDANRILNSNNRLYTTTKNVSEFFAVLTKFEVDSNAIWKYYENIRNNVNILFPVSESLRIFERLFKKYYPKGNRIYDVEIASIMLYYEIPMLSTFNIKDFQEIEEIDLYQIE